MRKNLEEKAMKNVTIDTKEVESMVQMEKKWRGVTGKFKESEEVVTTEINTSTSSVLPPVASTVPSPTITLEEPEPTEELAAEEMPTKEEEEEEFGAGDLNIEVDVTSHELPLASPLESSDKSSTTSIAPKIMWEGLLDMSNVGDMPATGLLKRKFSARGLMVSGPELPEPNAGNPLTVKGRIAMPKLHSYVGQVVDSPSRAVTVVVFEATGEEDQAVYNTAYSYFLEKVRILEAFVSCTKCPCSNEEQS